MHTERGLERLVFFTDAVVAIAITLLVLPLVDILGGHTVDFGDALDSLFGFAISFFVIARLWWAHHQVFESVERYSTPLVVANSVWLFTIALLPAATALVPTQPTSTGTVLIYVGTMLASSLALGVITLIAYRDRTVAPTPGTAMRRRLLGSGTSIVAFALALILGATVPNVHYWALLLLALTNPVEWLITRRWPRQDAAGV